MGYRCCIICGGTFKIEGKGRVTTCSDACRDVRLNCVVDGCGLRKKKNGYCQKHIARVLKWGDPERIGPLFTCVECGEEFEALTPWQTTCGEICRLAFKARYREENRDRRQAYNAEWRGRNRVNGRLKTARRRAIVRTVTFEVTNRDVNRLLRRHRYECAYCASSLQDGYHLDHVMPVNKGGTHSIGNLVPACARCNESKSDWLLYEWLLKQRVGRPLRRKKAS